MPAPADPQDETVHDAPDEESARGPRARGLPGSHAHTASEADGLPRSHAHTASEADGLPRSHAHTASEAEGLPRSHAHTASGARARSHAHAALRKAILSGTYAPGQRLVEEELAAIFDVTRASLRAALLDLTAEGLVERIPNRGARVRVVSIEEAVAITECRMVLESLCAVKAALVITDAEAAELRRLGDIMTDAANAGDVDKYSDLNHQMHRRVRDISGQHIAVSLLERLNAQLVRHQYRIAQRPGRPKHSLGEHLAIIDAVAGRRPADAEAATRRHLEGVIKAIRADVPATGDLADGQFP